MVLNTEIDWLAVITAIATVATAAFAYWAVRVYTRQANLLAKQTELLSEQIKLSQASSEKQLRAYIDITAIEFEQCLNVLMVNFQLENIGLAPAYGLRVTFLDDDADKDPIVLGFCNPRGKKLFHYFLSYQADPIGVVYNKLHKVGYIKGRIEYKDAFNKPHYYNFVREIMRNTNGSLFWTIGGDFGDIAD